MTSPRIPGDLYLFKPSNIINRANDGIKKKKTVNLCNFSVSLKLQNRQFILKHTKKQQ